MERNVHYLTIDLLRIFAAILVLLNHLATFGWKTASVVEGNQVAFGFLSAFAGTGGVGVEIFFVISGFVIAMSASGDGGLSHGLRFARIRAIRILPALWLSALISLVARVFHGEDLTLLLMDFGRSVILSPKGPYIDGVVWSLVVEAVFYFLVLVSILSKFRLSLYSLAKIIGFSSSVYLLIFSGLNMITAFHGSEEWISILSKFYFKLLMLQHGVFFATGMMFFILKNGNSKNGCHMCELFLITAFSVMGILEIFITVERSYEYKISAVVIWVVCMCVMESGVMYVDRVNRKMEKHRWLINYIGGLSYPLYLNHYSVGMIIVWVLFSFGLPAGVVFVLSMFSVLGLSMAVMWLERKIQYAVKGWFLNSTPNGIKLAM